LSNYFRLKQFSIKDDKSTFRISTDAILLGSWVDVKDSDIVLDIGTGCGIIALMLAQRSAALIDAIEIDYDSVKQAKENINKTSWNNRIQVLQKSLQAFVTETTKKYSLIISNPPFFQHSLEPSNEKKKMAKHSYNLTLKDLIIGTCKLLDNNGSFNVIFPELSCNRFIEVAAENGLYLFKDLKIRPRHNKKSNRRIMQFNKNQDKTYRTQTITILDTNNEFTEAFKNLTREYYLQF